MGRNGCRTVIIGLELGDGRLIERWANAGHLPTIAALRAGGAWGWLRTTAEQLHVSAWPSLYTGVGPGEHGVYFTFQPAPGVQGHRRFQPGLYGRPTFWHALSKAGVRCAVFDAPYTHPEDGFDGVQIFDWGTWAHYLAPASTPGPLLRRLEQACGAYPLGLEAHDLGLAALDPVATRDRLITAIEAKARASCWLLAETAWDVAFTVFGETHVAGHYCWVRETGGDAAEPQPLMLPIYQAVDRAIAAIQAAAGHETTLILVSGDGVGDNNAGWHLLPDVLVRLGYLGRSDGRRSEGAETEPARVRRFDPVRVVRDLLPKDFRKALARRLPTGLRDTLAQRVDSADIDWARTRAYSLPTDLEGYVRINLKGREPMGVVEPGADYEQACDELQRELAALVDPETNRPLVREVVRTDAAYRGERRPYLPDLVVGWRAEQPIAAAASPRIGTVSAPSPDQRPGTHAPPGFVVIRGPGVAAGTTLQDAHVFDLAPTLLTRCGVAVPDAMRGRAWMAAP